METIQQSIVNEHIDDLRREADSLRTERRMRHRTRDGDGPASATQGVRDRARVRLGHWLIGVGTAVSGSAGEAHAGTAEHSA